MSQGDSGSNESTVDYPQPPQTLHQNPVLAAHVHSYLPGVARVLLHNTSLSHGFDPLNPQILSRVPLLNMHNIVLFPGCSLPLRLRDPRWIQYVSRKVDDVRNVRNLSELNVFIGMVATSGRMSSISVGSFGTLGVIESTNDFEENYDPRLDTGEDTISDHDEVILTVQGTRRFRIVAKCSGNTVIGNLPLFDVEFLNDFDLPRLPLSVLSRIKPTYKFDTSKMSCFKESFVRNEIRYLGTITSIPIHVWRHLSPSSLVNKIRQTLIEETSWQGLTKCSTFKEYFNPLSPRPSDACFWLASNLPLSIHERKLILGMEYVVDMLKYLFDKLNSEVCEIICCRGCGSILSYAKDIFTVGGMNKGTCGAYVNEHGVIHQTTTLRTASRSNIFLQGHSETKDSWFPGYAWTIAGCKYCLNHLGWLFTNVDTSEDNPVTFWGFSLASIKSVSRHEYNQRNDFDLELFDDSQSDQTDSTHEVDEER